MGVVSSYFELIDNGIGSLTDAYRVGGMHGAVFERADDALDGEHGFEQVEDPEVFLTNLLDVLKTGKIPETSEKGELASYLSASYMQELLGEENNREYVSIFEDVVDLECKLLSEPDYDIHLESAGKTYEALFVALNDVTGYPLPDDRVPINNVGKLFQTADDLQDIEEDDYNVVRADIVDIQSDLVEDVDLESGVSRKPVSVFSTNLPKLDKFMDTKGLV